MSLFLVLCSAAFAADPPSGRIEGGWEYVIAAYAITWITFGLYTASLFARARREET
jgi:CcmD family protein